MVAIIIAKLANIIITVRLNQLIVLWKQRLKVQNLKKQLSILEKGVKLRLPTAVHRYLAMKTDFDIRGWELSPAKFEDKWRLALMIMQGIAQDDYVNYVFAGGSLYPIGGRDPVFCSKCLNEMTQIGDDTWICRHCDTSDVIKYA